MDFGQIQSTTFYLKIFGLLTICAFSEAYDFYFDSTTSKPNFHTDCNESGLLLVKGDVISIAEVIKTVECWQKANKINIFALNKVIFDDDIDKRDVLYINITIFAPTWEIIPPSMKNHTQRQILLNADSEFNFYGVCIEKINGERLEFSVDGDRNRIKMIFNNDRSMEEMSLLKPTAIFISSFNEVPTLQTYRHYARTHLEQTINHLNLWKFLVELKTQYGYADLNELIDDFLCLEDKYSELKKEVDVTPMYQSMRNQLEHPKQQLNGHADLRKVFHIALISKILANRNHTTITDITQLSGISFLKMKLNQIGSDLLRDHEEILASHLGALGRSTEWASELTAINTALVDKIYEQTVRNDNDTDDAILRYPMELSLKSIQLLLSTITEDSNLLIRDKKQSFLSKLFGKFQSRLTLFDEVLRNFVDILKPENADNQHTSNDLSEIQRTVANLLYEVNELLTQSDQNRTENLLNVLFNAWPNLSNQIEDAKSNTEIQMNQTDNQGIVTAIEKLNRMQGLIKCSEMGIEMYRDCRTDSRKLMSFVQRSFQKHRLLLEKLKEFEKSIYSAVMSLFEQSNTNQILQHLYELNGIFGEMQQNSSAYSSGIKRAIRDTNQAIKLTIDVYNNHQVIEDRQILMEKLKFHLNNQHQREHIEPEIQMKIDILTEIIKSNLMLEICSTSALQILKMHLFPFDQNRLYLCDLPINTNATWNSTNVRQILNENIKKFKSGKDDIDKDYRQQLIEDTITISGDITENNAIMIIWKYKDLKDEIHRLLRGEEIILNADVAISPLSNASKFHRIGLQFSFANKTKQQIFDNVASHHFLEMRMMGNHYYRCLDHFYYVPSINANFPLITRIDSKKSNLVSKTLNENGPFFSPYTLWKVKLREDLNTNDWKSKQIPFGRNLEIFIGDEIDLWLVGIFHFVNVGNRKDYLEEYMEQVCTSHESKQNYLFDKIIKMDFK